jgi:co-chaperonin GroES (HSP10)
VIGKVKVTSTGYNPDAPHQPDLTLGEPSGRIPAQTSEPTTKPVTVSPIGRRLLVVPVDQDVIPNSVLHVETGQLAKELRLCAVLAIGPKVALTHAALKPGVAVWLKPYFGTEIVVNGYTVLIIKPEDVQGIANLKG